MEKPSPEQLQFILESAILAPSADNHHRIHFQVSDDSILFRLAEGSLPSEGGYKRILVLLSLGAVVENLAIAASRFGMAADTALLPDRERPALVLRVRLQAGGAEPDQLWPAVPLRHTNRRLIFRGPRMSDAQRAQLDSAVHVYPTSKLVWLDEPERRKNALRLMRQAETERFHNRILHEEMFSAIRFDVGWHSTCPEGLPLGSLGVEPPLRMFFAQLRHWPLARLANLLGTHHILGFRSCHLPCRLAPHVGLVAAENPDSQSIFNAGRSFQRLWLAATAHGRVLQPMPASALYACDGARAEGIPPALQHDLAEGWTRILGDAVPLMLFRMGFAPESSIVTGRRPVADYLERA